MNNLYISQKMINNMAETKSETPSSKTLQLLPDITSGQWKFSWRQKMENALASQLYNCVYEHYSTTKPQAYLGARKYKKIIEQGTNKVLTYNPKRSPYTGKIMRFQWNKIES